MSIPSDSIRRLRLPAYIVIGYITIGSLADVLISTQPALIHDVRWRLGVGTLLTGASGTELLGAILFLAFAVAAVDQVALWTGFSLSLLIGLGYVAAAGGFTLDSLQMRGQIRPEMLTRYNIGTIWTVVRLAFTGLVFLGIAIAAWRAARAVARAVDRGAASPAATLVVGAQALAGAGAPPARPSIERPKAPTG